MKNLVRLLGGLGPLVGIAIYLTAGICGRVPSSTSYTVSADVQVVLDSLVDNGSTYDYYTTAFFYNTGDTALSGIVLQDTLRAPTGGTMAVQGYAILESGTATIDSTWDGSTTNPDLVTGPVSVAVDDSLVISYVIRVTPGVTSGPWYSILWGSGEGPDGEPTGVDSAIATYDEPPSSDVYEMGIAMKTGTVTFTGTEYTFPCSLIAENLGTQPTTTLQIAYDLDAAFTGTADLTSVSGLASTGLTVNSSFDGDTNTNIYASTQALAAATLDTVSFAAVFDAGSEAGPFTTGAFGYAIYGAQSDTDSSDCGGNPDPDGDGEADEAGENDKCTITLPSITTQIGIAKFMGSIGGVSGAYTIPCSLIVENLGDQPLTSVDVRDTLDTIFGGTSSLTSITNITSTGLTANSSFAGTAANDSVLTVSASDTLAAAAYDTLAFTITFDEGDQTEFFNSAWAYADGPLSSTTEDQSDWGTDPDPSGNGSPDDLGEDTPTRFTPPAEGSTTHDIVVDKAGYCLPCITFHEGEVDSSQAGSGDGFAVADSNAVEIDTQYEIAAVWPDGSIRLLWLAFEAPRSGTYDVLTLSTPQSLTPVTVSADPEFTIALAGSTYTFTAGDFSTPQPTDGGVYRQGYAEFDDGTLDYQSQPAGLAIRFWRRWYEDGSTRNWITIRNKTVISEGPVQGEYGAMQQAASYDEAVSADWAITRTAANVFQLRWADRTNLGSGGDTTTVHLWHSDSYDSPLGETYDYGGTLRPGEDLVAEITVGQDAEPAVGFETAERYASTKALPYTDRLYTFQGVPWFTGSDSLAGMWEGNSIAVIEAIDADTPHEEHWKNIRDVGQIYRAFDGSISESDLHTGQDQYEVNLGLFRFALCTSRVSSDTLDAHSGVSRTAYDLFERSARAQERPKYNIDYLGDYDCRFAHFMTWPHTEHGTSGVSYPLRSSFAPHMNYMHGVGVYPLYYMTRAPHLLEKINGMRVTNHYYTNAPWINGATGEGRAFGNALQWAATAMDFTTSTHDTEARDDAMEFVRIGLGSREFGVPPLPDPCGTSWFRDKIWMFNHSAQHLRQAITVFHRWGETVLAQELEGYLAQWQDFVYDYGIHQQTFIYPPTGIEHTFYGCWYSWGENGNPPICAGNCSGGNGATEDGCAEFWAAIGANLLVDYLPDTTVSPLLFWTAIRYKDSGYYTVGNWGGLQKGGISMQWAHDFLELRSQPAQSQSQRQQEAFFDN